MKRILTVLLLIIMLSIEVNYDYDVAYASGTVGTITQTIVKAIETAGAGGASGITLGGALVIALTLGTLGYGGKLALDNWDDPKVGVKAFIKNGGTFVQNWWQKLCDEAVYAKDGITKAGDLLRKGLDFDIWDYVIPANKGITMSVPYDISDSIAKFYSNYTNGNLRPGTYTSDLSVLLDIAANMGLTLTKLDFMNYKYIVATKLPTNNYSEYNLQVYASNNPFYTEIVKSNYDDKYYVTLTGTDVVMYAYQHLSNNTTECVVINYPNLQPSDEAFTCSGLIYNMYLKDTKYNAFDTVLYTTLNLQYGLSFLGNMQKTITVKESQYGYDIDNLGKAKTEGQTIAIDNNLTDELSKIKNIDNITTDDIVKAIRNADITAQKDGTKVVSIPIDATGTQAKVDDKVRDIADAVSGTIEKIFIPDKAVVTEFVDDMNDKINNSTGILTMPLALVIKFLNQILTLGSGDCILDFPAINFKGHMLFAGTSFNFTEYVNKSDFKEIYDMYKIITDAILILGVLKLAQKKGEEIVRGN